MPLSVMLPILFIATGIAVVFHNPRLSYLVAKTILHHRRERAASIALREMRYNDIRRSR